MLPYEMRIFNAVRCFFCGKCLSKTVKLNASSTFCVCVCVPKSLFVQIAQPQWIIRFSPINLIQRVYNGTKETQQKQSPHIFIQFAHAETHSSEIAIISTMIFFALHFFHLCQIEIHHFWFASEYMFIRLFTCAQFCLFQFFFIEFATRRKNNH